MIAVAPTLASYSRDSTATTWQNVHSVDFFHFAKVSASNAVSAEDERRNFVSAFFRGQAARR